MDNKNCKIYIDESGDLGFGRGTKWFVLSAVIVDHDQERYMRDILANIKTRLNIKTLHFRELRNFEQKIYVVNELCKGSFTFINIIVDTEKIDMARLPEENPSNILYNYTCRYLIERVSWFLRDTGRVGDVILSSRGTSRDKELIDYINDKLLNYDYNEISHTIKSVTSKTAPSWDMLQLADICATSLFYSFETNGYGFAFPCFMKMLRPYLYRRDGKLMKYGIKFYSDDMEPEEGYFDGKIICRNRKTPGATSTCQACW